MDHDRGDNLYYSGSNSHENKDPNNAVISHDTQAMRTSHRRTLPIRVIRSHKSDWENAPSLGLRYDGLYRIIEEQERLNPNGGAYIRFKLVRLGNQPPMDLSQPTAVEQRDFPRYKNYY